MSAVVQHQDTSPVGVNPAGLLQIAVENGLNVESLTKLLDLQERFEREQARKAFFAARVQFQALCPTIKKDKKVSFNSTKYAYATLSGIADQLRPHMETCGLTYHFEFDESEDEIKVTCIVSHEQGHTESNTMKALPDDSGSKNKIQQRGSTVSYLQRYTLIGALGLTSAMEDDDGKSSGQTNVETIIKHVAAAREHFDTVAAIKQHLALDQYEEAIEARNELTDAEVMALNLAPTKGGIFTTEEREKMKSDEWGAARRAVYEKSKEVNE